MSSKVSSELKRIQYTLEDKTPSSLTIDINVYNALAVKFTDANQWCKEMAKESREQLRQEAEELKAQGRLVKIDNLGNNVEMTVSEYIKGKVSSSVRNKALKEIIDPKYLRD